MGRSLLWRWTAPTSPIHRSRIFGISSRSLYREPREEREEREDRPDREYPQNKALKPLIPPKRKPFFKPLPIVVWEYKRDKRLGLRRLWKAPLNGMLVEELIPLAHEVLKEYAVVEEGVKRLMKSVAVKACSCCMELYVSRVGHRLPTCRGTSTREIYGQHRWIRGYVEDVLIPLECYHVHNRLGPTIYHSQRYTVPRVPAIHELCMQAGVDDPSYPMIRWARKSGRQVGDGQAQVPLTRFLNKIIPGYSDESSSDSSDDESEGTVVSEGLANDGETVAQGMDEKDYSYGEKLQVNYEGLVAEETNGLGENCEDLSEEGITRENQDVKELVSNDDITVEVKMAEDRSPEDDNDTTIEMKLVDDQGLETEAKTGKLKFKLQEDLLDLQCAPSPQSSSTASTSSASPSSSSSSSRSQQKQKWDHPCGPWTKPDTTSEAEKQELKAVAERTLVAFDTVRKGLQGLLYKYKVWTCGYCSEIHVGIKPHKVLLCGGLGRGYRGGGHAWQEAALSDIFPPNFVWHVPANQNPRLSRELIRYYGQAPAVVELCVQAGAEPPARWNPYMRLDMAIPDEEEMLWAS